MNEYNVLIQTILNQEKREKDLIKTIRRLVGIIEQQQPSTETIQRCVDDYLEQVEADYMQAGIMDAIDRGLHNAVILSITEHAKLLAAAGESDE